MGEDSLKHPGDEKESPHLFRRSIKGGLWVMALRVFIQGMYFVRLILFTNLLGISNWGILGVALLMMQTLDTFTSTGFRSALIQKKENIASYLDTSWTIGLIRGVILFAVLYSAAPYAVVFFDRSVEFTESHIRRPEQLVLRLTDESDAVVEYLREGFSGEALTLLEEYDDSADDNDALKTALAEEFNRVIGDEHFYDSSRFADRKLSAYIGRLVEDAESGGDVVRLNRRLLEEVLGNSIENIVLDRPLAVRVIRIMIISFLIGALGNISTVYFRKELEFRKQFIYQISGSVADLVVAVSIILIYRTVWAFVIGRLAAAVVRCIVGYIIRPYRPRLRFDIEKAGELWQFGKWILAGSILGFILTQGDDYFVGCYLSVFYLALYQMAFKYCSIPATEITNVISQVTFPAYSKIQDDTVRLRSAYLKVLLLTAFLSVPTAGLIFVLSSDFVMLFLRPEWQPIIPVMQILAFKGLFRSIGSTRGPLFNAIGRPRINIKLHILRLILLAILIYPLTRLWGICGTALATVLIAVIVNPFGAYLAFKVIRCSVWQLIRPTFYPVVSTVVMVAAVLSAKHFIFDQITFISFAVLGIIGVCTYLSAIYVCEKFFDYEIYPVLAEQMKVLSK